MFRKLPSFNRKKVSPIIDAFEPGGDRVNHINHVYHSIVRLLGNPYLPSGDRILRLLREHDGTAIAVPDTETVAAQRDLARMEGVFAEPAGAIALAGLIRLMQ